MGTNNYAVINAEKSFKSGTAIYMVQSLTTGEVKVIKAGLNEMPNVQVVGLSYANNPMATDGIDIALQPYNALQHTFFCLQQEIGEVSEKGKLFTGFTVTRNAAPSEKSGDLEECGVITSKFETGTFYKGKLMSVRVKLTALKLVDKPTVSMIRLEAKYTVNYKPVDDLYTCLVFGTNGGVQQVCKQVDMYTKEFVALIKHEVYRVQELKVLLQGDGKKVSSGVLSTIAYKASPVRFAYSLESLLGSKIIKELNVVGMHSMIGSDKTPYIDEFGDDVTAITIAIPLVLRRSNKRGVTYSVTAKVITGSKGICIEVLHVSGPSTLMALNETNYTQYKTEVLNTFKVEASKVTAKAIQGIVSEAVEFIQAQKG